MTCQSLSLSAAILLAGGLALSQAPAPADPDMPVTRTYDLKPLLGDKSASTGLSDADAVIRLIPGVLGDSQSAVDESFGPDGGLEYP